MNSLWKRRMLPPRKTPRIVVLGADGMLGSYICRYFGEEAIPITRKEFEITNNPEEKNDIEQLLTKYALGNNCLYVFNAIGLTNKINASDEVFRHINGGFPVELGDVCTKLGLRLIHASTDCVFSGTKPFGESYSEIDDADAKDVYGISKHLGETCDGMVLRLSIIGQDPRTKRGLWEFVKSKGLNCYEAINGYTNHTWNGVTCLEYAKIVDQIMKNNLYRKGVVHVVPPYVVTKHQLVGMIVGAHGFENPVNETVDGANNNKVLSTTLTLSSNLNIATLPEQIRETLMFDKINNPRTGVIGLKTLPTPEVPKSAPVQTPENQSDDEDDANPSSKPSFYETTPFIATMAAVALVGSILIVWKSK